MMNIPHEEDLICVYPTTETQTKIIGLINSVGNLLIVCSGCAFFFSFDTWFNLQVARLLVESLVEQILYRPRSEDR